MSESVRRLGIVTLQEAIRMELTYCHGIGYGGDMGHMFLAIFQDPDRAEQAMYELEHFGYNPVEIAVEGDSVHWEDRREVVVLSATAGALVGAAVGAIVGVLVAIGLIPGLAGLMVGMLLGLGLSGASSVAITLVGMMIGLIIGAIIGAVAGLRLPLEANNDYARAYRRGSIVIGIPEEGEIAAEVRVIVDRHGAEHVGMTRVAATRVNAPRYTPSRDQMVFGERRNPSVDVDAIHASKRRTRRR